MFQQSKPKNPNWAKTKAYKRINFGVSENNIVSSAGAGIGLDKIILILCHQPLQINTATIKKNTHQIITTQMNPKMEKMGEIHLEINILCAREVGLDGYESGLFLLANDAQMVLTSIWGLREGSGVLLLHFPVRREGPEDESDVGFGIWDCWEGDFGRAVAMKGEGRRKACEEMVRWRGF